MIIYMCEYMCVVVGGDGWVIFLPLFKGTCSSLFSIKTSAYQLLSSHPQTGKTPISLWGGGGGKMVQKLEHRTLPPATSLRDREEIPVLSGTNLGSQGRAKGTGHLRPGQAPGGLEHMENVLMSVCRVCLRGSEGEGYQHSVLGS